MKTRRRGHLFVFACVSLAAFLSAGKAQATTLLVSKSNGELGYGYGFYEWDNFTAAINTAFGNQVTTVSDFNNLAQMLSYDRLLLDQRWTSGTLGATEAANIATFAATGRRVLMMGENNSWPTWNPQILGIVGGTYAGEYNGSTNRLILNDITAGAPTLDLPFAGRAGVAGGGTALYNQNFATLWGASENVLTVLDVNVWDDSHWDVSNGGVFGTNVANWLAGVPEPGSVALAGFGVAAFALVRLRKA